MVRAIGIGLILAVDLVITILSIKTISVEGWGATELLIFFVCVLALASIQTTTFLIFISAQNRIKRHTNQLFGLLMSRRIVIIQSFSFTLYLVLTVLNSVVSPLFYLGIADEKTILNSQFASELLLQVSQLPLCYIFVKIHQ